MSVKKWSVIGVILIALACVAVGKPEFGGMALTGLIGFLKSDEDK